MSINKLSTQLIVEAYYMAKELKLDIEFIGKLSSELSRRNINNIDNSF